MGGPPASFRYAPRPSLPDRPSKNNRPAAPGLRRKLSKIKCALGKEYAEMPASVAALRPITTAMVSSVAADRFPRPSVVTTKASPVDVAQQVRPASVFSSTVTPFGGQAPANIANPRPPRPMRPARGPGFCDCTHRSLSFPRPRQIVEDPANLALACFYRGGLLIYHAPAPQLQT